MLPEPTREAVPLGPARAVRAGGSGPGRIASTVRTAHAVLAVLARGLLICAGGLVLWSTAPAAFGWQPTVVMSGSMRPALAPGDVVLTRPVAVDQLRPGRVVLADDPDHPGRLRLHRLSRIEPDGALRLRGDANQAADSTPVRQAAVHGVGALRVPRIASPVVWVREHRYGTLAGTMLGLVVVAWLARTPRPGRHHLPSRPSNRHDRGNADRPPGRSRRRLALATSTLGTALLAAAVVAGSHLAWPQADARFTRQTANAGSSFGAAAVFSAYRAAVLASSPYLYWRLAETTGGTAADESGNGKTGTYAANVTRGATSALPNDPNPAVTLTGSNQSYVAATGASTPQGDFSVEIWFKTGTSAGGRLIGFGNAATGSSFQTSRQLYLGDDGRLSLGYVDQFGGKTVVTSPFGTAYNDRQWHYAVGTVTGTTPSLYVDGHQVASGYGGFGVQNYTGYWRVGYDALPGGFGGWPAAPFNPAFNGSVDEAATYPSALSSTQVTAHWNAR
ncbi:LamG-like jellyroll fold domain-containing protein [Flindersiella endophytica]